MIDTFGFRFPLSRILVQMAAFLALVYSGAMLASTASSVDQHGITWHFDKDYQVGQYANGDWWVVGPVTITRITPESTTVNGRVVHGSMLNPNGFQNGWDSHSSTDAGTYPSYNSQYNVAPSVAGQALSLSEGSIVSAISSFSSNIGGSNRGVIDKYAILTVVPEAPPEGAFRPDPYGTDKTSYWTESRLDYGILRSLPPVANTPSLQNVIDSVSGFWNDHIPANGGWRQQPFTARSFQRSYGRDIGNDSGHALLSLHLDYSNEEKRDLFVHMVQKGIDIYGRQQLGGDLWSNNGAHYGSQKARMVLAAMALGDADMIAASDAEEYLVHGMDQQTFYVTQEDVDRVSDNDSTGTSGNSCGTSGASLYEPEDLGIAEWGRSHTTAPAQFDCRLWGASYRWIGGSYAGNVLAIQLIPGAKEAWNHPALFDYSDRYFDIETDSGATWGVGGGANQLRAFFADMYKAYSGLAGETGGPRPSPPIIQGDPR